MNEYVFKQVFSIFSQKYILSTESKIMCMLTYKAEKGVASKGSKEST